MFSDDCSEGDFWCPLADGREADERLATSSVSAAEREALSRVALGEWLSDAHISRLQELGLVERVFGQALLTRLGRVTVRTASA